jgi:predicted nucleic acid-binding protein
VIVIGDTSGLVAALNSSDPEHRAARGALSAAAATVVTPLVFMEIEHVTTRNVHRQAAQQVNDWLLDQVLIGRVVVPQVSVEALRRARGVQDAYGDLELDLADAVNVVVAEEFETECVLTLDRRDFRAIRPLTGHPAFRLLPDDL